MRSLGVPPELVDIPSRATSYMYMYIGGEKITFVNVKIQCHYGEIAHTFKQNHEVIHIVHVHETQVCQITTLCGKNNNFTSIIPVYMYMHTSSGIVLNR